MRWPHRYSLVPWLGPPDLSAMGIPEYEWERDGEKVIGLWIPSPFGKGTDEMLMIRAVRDTGRIVTYIGRDELSALPPARDEPLQSNPRRADDTGED